MTATSVGTIIYLNGTSSAGKTTLARALQDTLPAPYLYISLDDFSRIFPARYVAVQALDALIPPLAREGLVFRTARDAAGLTMAIELGPAGRRYMRGFRQMIRALAISGNNLIVDDVFYDPTFLGDAVAALADLPVCFVGVRCDPEVTARREWERGDRAVGMAAWQAPRIHAGAEYDLTVDTTATTPDACAAAIAALVAQPPQTTAFARMYRRMFDEVSTTDAG